jgi:drug/metabolite transporter (DMT)-like permease
MTPSLTVGPLVFGLVLLAAVLHASWNALLKVAGDSLTSAAIMNATGLVVGLAMLCVVPAPAPASWPMLIASALIHFGYYIFLLGSYRFGDLSQVYPLARGMGPLLVAFLSPWLIGERLGTLQLGGVVLLCLGIFSLAFNRLRFSDLSDWKPVTLALATGVTIAAYTLTDGTGVRRSESPAGYIAWLFVLDGIAIAVVAAWIRGRGLGAAVRKSWKVAIPAGLIAMLAYGIVMWCYSLGAIAPIAALRETGVVIAAAIGAVLLREPFGRWRIVAASFCAIGILAINLPVH